MPAVIAGILVVLGLIRAVRQPIPEFSTVRAERRDLLQHVTETGSVVANADVAFGFETTGRVERVAKKIGDAVVLGDVIARLESRGQSARLAEAAALLSSAQARLNLELAGPSAEDIKKSLATVDQARAKVEQVKAQRAKTAATADASVASAEKVLESARNDLQLAEKGEDSQIVADAYADLINEIKSSFAVASDALGTADNVVGVDNQYANDAYENGLGGSDSTRLEQSKKSYRAARDEKLKISAEVSGLGTASAHDAADAGYQAVSRLITLTVTTLFDVKLALDFAFPAGDLSQIELNTLKDNVNTVQTSMSASAIKLTNAWQGIGTARNSLASYKIAYDKAATALDSAKRQSEADKALSDAQVMAEEASFRQAEAAHEILIAPPRAVDLGSLRADVARQAANVSALRKELDKASLVAPLNGVLSKLDIEVGENVSGATPVATIVSPDLRLDVDIAESDIAKLSLNDPAEIILDAFSDDRIFTGKVIVIEPGQTEVSGVIYYKIKLVFDEASAVGVRPGMTANVEILTDKKEAVIAIPGRSILEEAGKKKVRILTNAKRGVFDFREVTTGLRGDDGLVEIISGVNEGDVVITFIREK